MCFLRKIETKQLCDFSHHTSVIKNLGGSLQRTHAVCACHCPHALQTWQCNHKQYIKFSATSDVQLGVVVHGGLPRQLAQTLGGAAVHHQAERAVLNQQLDCMEKPIVHRFHAVTHRKKGENLVWLLLEEMTAELCTRWDGGVAEKKKKKSTEKIGSARRKTDVFKSNKLFIPPCLCFVGFAN